MMKREMGGSWRGISSLRTKILGCSGMWPNMFALKYGWKMFGHLPLHLGTIALSGYEVEHDCAKETGVVVTKYTYGEAKGSGSWCGLSCAQKWTLQIKVCMLNPCSCIIPKIIDRGVRISLSSTPLSHLKIFTYPLACWDIVYTAFTSKPQNFVWIFLCMHEALCLSRGVDYI